MTEWTRNDLPDEGELADLIRDALDGGIYEGKMLLPGSRLRAIIDLLVRWLNAHHPKPGHPMGTEAARWRRERDEALRKKGEAFDRAVRAERELGELRSKVNAWGRERTAPAVSRAEIEEQLRIAYESGNHPIQRIRIATDAVCDLFGVEAEQAVDPVEEKARELYEVGNPGTVLMWESIHEEFKDGYRRIALHVLGQEADQ